MDLKNLLHNRDITKFIGVYDPITCILAEQANFEAVWLSGFCVSASYGIPDANFISFETMINILCKMRNVSDIPILADCDTGYGDFHNVRYVTKLLEQNNIDGICIEDKTFPKINSYCNRNNQKLETIENFLNKIKMAVDTKKSNRFCVIARTEALVFDLGIDEALTRANLYYENGADAIVVQSKSKEPDEIIKFAKQWNKECPLIVIPTSYPKLTIDVAKKVNISGIIYANQLMRASIYAMNKYLEQLKSVISLSDCTQDICTMDDIFKLQKMDEYNYYENLYNMIK